MSVCLGDLSWPGVLDGLRAVEKLLRPPTMRERFLAVCVRGHEDAHLLQTWSRTLRSLRWEAIVDFTKDLLAAEPLIRQTWSLQTFLGGDQNHKKWKANSDFGPSVESIDAALTSAAWWTGVSIVHDVAFEAEYIGRWAEGCPCGCSSDSGQLAIVGGGSSGRRRRQKQQSQAQACPFRGCRAGQLAAGDWIGPLKNVMAASRSRVTQFLVMSRDNRSEYFSDWTRARGKLWTGLQVKLSYWAQLPWRLCS